MHDSQNRTADEYSQPTLEGTGASDYERYLRTDELLSLQKPPGEMTDRDELLFQTVHQSSELWLKLAVSDSREAAARMGARDLAGAIRLLRRSSMCVQYITQQLEMLEQMSPWEYQEIRKVLGHGSGFDSPGFRGVRDVAPVLRRELHRLLDEAGLELVELYRRGREFEDLYQLAELLTDWDERVTVWRFRHYTVVARVLGEDVVGTQGTPVQVLGRLIAQHFFPELWSARRRLVEISGSDELDEPLSSEPAG